MLGCGPYLIVSTLEIFNISPQSAARAKGDAALVTATASDGIHRNIRRMRGARANTSLKTHCMRHPGSRPPAYLLLYSLKHRLFKRTSFWELFTNTKQMLIGADEDSSVGNRGRGQATFTQQVFLQQSELSPGFQHKGFPGFVQKEDFPITPNGGCGKNTSNPFLPDHFARIGIR